MITDRNILPEILATVLPLPSQCSTYTTITDGTRRASNTVLASLCDNTIFTASPTWVRFSGAAGTQLSTTVVVINRCGTQATGAYTGTMPVSVGATTTGSVCYNWSSNSCNWSNSISVTNCNSFYVYALIAPPGCSFRYCTV